MSGKRATATTATYATQEGGKRQAVTNIAVAESPQGETVPLKKVCSVDKCTGTVSKWWLIHYSNRKSQEVSCCPEVTRANILERYADAIAAEPFSSTIRQASSPLTASEEIKIREWLAKIGETDSKTVEQVVDQCRQDLDARNYFLSR